MQPTCNMGWLCFARCSLFAEHWTTERVRAFRREALRASGETHLIRHSSPPIARRDIVLACVDCGNSGLSWPSVATPTLWHGACSADRDGRANRIEPSGQATASR